jgi:serine/threonine protein kinase
MPGYQRDALFNLTLLSCICAWSVPQRSYTEKADVWAIGVCLYILLCGKPPFEHALDDEIFRMIVDNGVPDFSYHAWDNITEPAKVRCGFCCEQTGVLACV